MIDAGIEQRRIATNGIELNVAVAGPEDGPLVILLHGFPEFWYAWRKQIPLLAQAGCRVMAPDLPGYNLSDKPRALDPYRADVLAKDIVGLIDSARREQAVVVGHDWGGAVAWATAMIAPARVSRLVVLNCGHPVAMLRRIRKDRAQLKRSWYIFAFQVPWLPEMYMRARDFDVLARALTRTSRRGTFSDEDLARYRQAWSRPGALTAMVNYYRAALQSRGPRPSLRVTVPTSIVWGARDAFLGRELAADSAAFCDDVRVTYLEDATHWVQHEEALRVADIILGVTNPGL
jgi:pimeloyl-ACP methyl ester carboxylesterase